MNEKISSFEFLYAGLHMQHLSVEGRDKNHLKTTGKCIPNLLQLFVSVLLKKDIVNIKHYF